MTDRHRTHLPALVVVLTMAASIAWASVGLRAAWGPLSVAPVTPVAYVASGQKDETTQKLALRGREQTLYLYGATAGTPVIVSSGDGGWVHLAPDVARFLATKGYFVVGFDSRAYLSGFTTDKGTLQPQDEGGDYLRLVEFATSSGRGAASKVTKPILIGVSEGAGLSVLAATDPRTKAAIAGVIGLGLPNVNELAWRWKDALIYLTHGIPNEPTFQTMAVVEKMAPLPLAAIQSTHDEFVSTPEVQQVLQRAKDPKRLWFVEASNHRFSDNQPEFQRRLLEAIAWVTQNSPR